MGLGAGSIPVVGRVRADLRDDEQPAGGGAVSSPVSALSPQDGSATPAASVSPATAALAPDPLQGPGKQAATPGAGVAGPGVRRAVGPRPASASSPLPAPPAVPQADPVIPTAPAIAPVAVETHAGVAAGEALSAGSSPVDQPSVSFDGAVSPRAGAAQALQRASDDRARPSQAAEDANHDDLPDQATPASTTPAEELPNRTVSRALVTQSARAPSRSGGPTDFVAPKPTYELGGPDAGATPAAPTLETAPPTIARTLETASSPAAADSGAGVSQPAKEPVAPALRSERADAGGEVPANLGPGTQSQSQSRPLLRLSSRRASRHALTPAPAPVSGGAATTESDAPTPALPALGPPREVQTGREGVLHRVAAEPDGAPTTPKSMKPSGDSPLAPAQAPPSPMASAAQASTRSPAIVPSSGAESLLAAGVAFNPPRPPSASASRQRSLSRTADAVDEGERGGAAAIGVRPGSAIATAVALRAEPSHADRSPLDGIRAGSGRTASRRLHRLSARPVQPKPETTDRETGQPSAPAIQRADEPLLLAITGEPQPAALPAAGLARSTRWSETPASVGSAAVEPATRAGEVVARTAEPETLPRATTRIQREPDPHPTTDVEGSRSFEAVATAARPALSSTAERASDDLGSRPLSRERLDEIYDAVAHRLRRELLLSRERNGSLL